MSPPRRDYDLRDDFDDQPHRRRTNPALIVGLVLGGVLLGAMVCAGIALFGFWAAAPVAVVQNPAVVGPAADGEELAGAPDAKEDGTAPRTYTRDEFHKRVMGKTPDEVIAAVGKPDETTEAGADARWTYRNRIKAPAPGKSARTSVVVFRDGKVVEVTY